MKCSRARAAGLVDRRARSNGRKIAEKGLFVRRRSRGAQPGTHFRRRSARAIMMRAFKDANKPALGAASAVAGANEVPDNEKLVRESQFAKKLHGSRGSLMQYMPGKGKNDGKEEYPSIEQESTAATALVSPPAAYSKKDQFLFLDPNAPHGKKVESAARYVQMCYRGYKVRWARRHRMYRVNLQYELSLLKARKDRRGMCFGFCQRAHWHPPACPQSARTRRTCRPPPPTSLAHLAHACPRTPYRTDPPLTTPCTCVQTSSTCASFASCCSAKRKVASVPNTNSKGR